MSTPTSTIKAEFPYQWEFTQFLTNEDLTEKQQAFMEAVFNRAKGEIQLDFLLGVLPDSLASYDDLGEYVEPNHYGGRTEPQIETLGTTLFPVDTAPRGSIVYVGSKVLYVEACVAITERLHQWLMLRSENFPSTDDEDDS